MTTNKFAEQATDVLDEGTVILRVDTAGRSALSAALCGVAGGGTFVLGAASYLNVIDSKPAGISGLICWLAISAFFVWATTLNAWRFFGPDYDAVIAPDGLTLHPSQSSRLIGWDEVAASRVVSKYIRRVGMRTVIELDLTKRPRSLLMPFGSKYISIVQGGPSYPRQMKDAARLIRKYRLAAGWTR